MNSIFVVLIVGAVAAVALAVPYDPVGELEVLRQAKNSSEIKGKLCIPRISRDKKFPAEGVVCHCKGLLVGRWECKADNTSTTTTTTASPEPVTDLTTSPTDPSTASPATDAPSTDAPPPATDLPTTLASVTTEELPLDSQ